MKPVSCSRIISNLHNVARNAAITASAQRASDDVRRVSRSKRGSGNAMVAGLYTGAHDSTIDVEVVDVSSGALQASAPVVSGVGSGTLTVGAVAAGSAAETITLTLLDAGTPDKAATFDFFGHEIAAAVAGPAGNAIALTVTRNLTHTKVGAVLDTIAAGTIDLDGQGWDFGQPSGDGQTVPSDALRLRFAGHPTVHRSWRTWDGGAWVYHIDPAVPYEVLSDTVAEAVTGDYEISVSNGVTTETYRAITVYDFLREARARSALLEVRAAVVNDRTAGGMATVEIPLRTDAYALPATVTTKVDTRVVLGDARAGAVTENISLKYLGADMWSVTGAASGAWPNAATGVPYWQGPAGFTVVRHVKPVANALMAHIWGGYKATSRQEGEGLPAVCLKPLRLGARATDKTITFEYRKRPPADCPCEHLPALAVSDVCLGLADGGYDMTLDPAYQTRLTELYTWRSGFLSSNVAAGDDDYARADLSDIDIADGATRAFAQALADAHQDAAAMTQWDVYFAALQDELDVYEALRSGALGTLTAVRWQVSTAYEVGALVKPVTPDGRLYRVVILGTSGATAPAWDEGTVADGDVTYEALPAYWSASASVAADKVIQPGNGRRYKATAGGTTGTTEPYWPDSGTVTDGGVTWAVDVASGRRVITAADLRMDVARGGVYSASASFAGSHASASAQWRVYAGDVLLRNGFEHVHLSADGRVVLELLKAKAIAQAEDEAERAGASALELIRYSLSATVETFGRKYTAQMDHVRALAGIVPKSDASSGAGSACWRDPGGSYWWADTEGYYMPAFTNHPYVSVIKTADGELLSTQEFGFGVVMPEPCVSRLKEGDTVTIKISGTGNAEEYGDDDEIVIPVIAAAPARLVNGEDGDAAQTWTVRGTASGTLPDWLYDPGAPAVYPHGPAPLTLTPGGVPFAEGDTIRFDIAGGAWRWRRDGGAWTTEAIYGPPQDLGDGMTLTAQGGSAPAFVEGDRWQYRAHATYGPDRLRVPTPDEWFGWDGDALMLDADLGAVVDIEAVALWALQLAETAIVTLSGGAAAAGEWSVTPVRTPDGVLLAPLGGLHAVRYLRVTVTGAGAEGGALGWLWAGQGWQPTVGASSLTLRRRYALARGDSLNPSALYRGRGTGGTWSWSIADGGAVFDVELRGLLALLDHVALNGLEPVLLVPSIKEPQLASMAILDADDIDMDDVLNWQAGVAQRAVSVDLAFRGVM